MSSAMDVVGDGNAPLPSESCPHGGGAGHLCLQAFLSHPSGWVALNDWSGTRLAADSLGSTSVRQRAQKVTNPFIEGQFVVHTVRDEVTENISVTVRNPTLLGLKAAVERITQALDQPRFRVVLWIGDHWIIWYANASDYSIEMSAPFLHERMAKITATVYRYPVAYDGLSV